MTQLQRMLSNGQWVDDDRVDQFVSMAASFKATTDSEIVAQLEAGTQIRYDADWYANIRYKPIPRAPRPEPKMVRCDCGHSVPEGSVMSASLGTSCHRCYDRMSDSY